MNYAYHRFHLITTSLSLNFQNYHLTPTRIVVCSARKFSMEGIESENMVVGDTLSLQKKIAAIRAAGPSKLQVIADFDATLTKYNINGQRGQTSHGLLQQGNPEYDRKRQELYDHYRPIEICPEIPIDEKTKLMEEWWGKTHGLLVEGGLTFDDIRKSVANARMAFREGVIELFEILEEKNVPILIFSAGLADIIEEVLRQRIHRSFKNIEIVSNRMVFDNEGNLSAFKGKTIHVLNKNEHALDMAEPLHDKVGAVDAPVIDYVAMKQRTNVLLLGDHIGDLGMSDGLDYETRISVGFLNDKVNESLESYKKAFDVVFLVVVAALSFSALFLRLIFYLKPVNEGLRESVIRSRNDAPMSGVVNLLSQLIKDG